MADDLDDTEKTEDPTQKRLDDALERGDVAKSQEVNTWFVIGGATLILSTFSNSIGAGLQLLLGNLIANVHLLRTDGDSLMLLLGQLEMALIAILGVPFLLMVIAAAVGNLIQHRFVWSSEGLTPKFSKVSPMAGLKRLFSKQALANFAKGVIKLAVVGAVLTAILWPQRRHLNTLVRMDLDATLDFSRALSLEVLGTVVALLAIIAAGDYLFQYRQWFERQKMSVRELKDEFKQTEGDPQIKSRIRQLRQSRARKRMMAAVPTASVVITNPTHFAVALKYERGMPAPICVAKGVDALAFKIREVARSHNVPVIENPPLARALHATADIDAEIPVEHYQAVAEVIGYVMRLKRGWGRAN